MQMCRPVRMALLGAQQVAAGTIGRLRVAGRAYAAEEIVALDIGQKTPAQIHLRLGLVLVLVKADRRSLPDIDLNTGQRLAVDIANLALGLKRHALGIATRNAIACLAQRRILAP